MGKKGKVGRQRKDNYYKLAKQKGFRSRAAFKLIQLNRKFQFLENSRVCVDLCAAPGGWLQIASEYMPVSSVIVGVDLAPISPIRNVITFQSDITTEECSKTITNTLAGWKADVVLHDGAPNVGRNWLHDAYSQNVLVVNALKIACSHLTKGGWFITKIFRSADYTSLIWVFGKLFGKVHATKPQASRQESAEIFVVCQNYKDPENIDPRFFDPTALFAEISDFDDNLKKQKADLLKPANKIKKTKAIGYEDIEALKLVTDVAFVTTNNHMDDLAQCHQIKLNNTDILAHPATDDEIKECCKDLRVLGRKDLLKLLKWRRLVRKDLTAKLMSSQAVANSNGSTPCDQSATDEIDYDQLTIPDDDDEKEPELCLDDIEAMQDEEKRKEEKRFKRIEEKRRLKLQERAKYGLDNQGDVLIEEELDLFNLKSLGSKYEVGQIDDVEPDQLLDEQLDLDDIAAEKRAQRKSVTFSREPQVQYFDNEKDYESDEDSVDLNADKGPIKPGEAKIQAPKSNLKNSNRSSSGVFNRLNSSSNSGIDLITDLMDINQSKIASASRFFDEDIFGSIDLEQEFETDLVEKMTKKKDKSIDEEENEEGNKEENEDEDEIIIDKKPFDQNMDRFDDASSESDTNSDSDDDSDDPSHAEDLGQGLDDDITDTDEEEAEKQRPKKRIKLGPEGLAMAAMMVSSGKNRKMLEDEGWNRFSQGDSHLAPKWFRDDEAIHCRRNLPVTPELVKEYKQRLREIDSKPIKKVMQAKARKKRRAMKKMDRVRKKVEAITSNEDMTQRDRIQQVRTVYKNATKTKKKEVKLVVGRKGLPTKKPGKAKYKMVDSRLKKDLRAKQRRESKSKGGKSKSGKGRGTGRRPPPSRESKSRTNAGNSSRGSGSKKSSKSGGKKRSGGGKRR